MSSVSSRQIVLDRVRAATQGAAGPAYADLPRNYIRRGTLDRAARCALMVKRLREYGAEVAETDAAGLPDSISLQIEASGRHTFVAPAGIPAEYLIQGFNWKLDQGLTYDEIEGCDGVVTAAFAGVADSGTIVLHHSPMEGRRVISLLPDWHLCILRVRQIVETFPEYVDLCQPAPTLATYISGPSATADIEMTRIKGVHGPRFLNVILVHDEN